MKRQVEGLESAKKSAEDKASKVAELECKKKQLEFALKTTTKYAGPQGSYEHEELAELNQTGLITMIEEVQHDFFANVPRGFKNVVAQMKVLDKEVELNTKGLHILKKVKNCKLCAPYGFIEDKEGDEEENQA